MFSKQKVLTKAGVERIILDHLQQLFSLHRFAQMTGQGIEKPVEANLNEIDCKRTHDGVERVV